MAKGNTVNLFDINTVAPDYFEVRADATEWTRRCKAFYDTMNALGRAVLLQYNDDDGKLYLSSVEADVEL